VAEDLSRNKCFFQVRISHVLRFISIRDLFTECLSYMTVWVDQGVGFAALNLRPVLAVADRCQ
jgi:hypothetical protein